MLLSSFQLALLSVLALTCSAPAADWPQFLGPTRNGVYPDSDLADSWPRSGPPVVWKKPVGQGFAAPVVAAGRLILFHRLADRETIDCLDAATGNPLWSFDYPTAYRDDFGFDEGPRATPTISDGRVYTFGAEGILTCLDFATGKKLWAVDTHAKFHVEKGFFGAAGSPLVEGDRVLMNIGGRPGAGLVAFDKSTGRVLWSATTDEAGYSSPVAATIAGRRRALFFTRAGLVCADPATGSLDFRFPWRARINASVNAATPLAIGDLVFISASYQTGAALLRIRPPDAGSDSTTKTQSSTTKTDSPLRFDKLWSSDDILSNHYATSVHHAGHLFGFHGRQEYGPALRCVDLMTGKVLWSLDRFGAGTVTLAARAITPAAAVTSAAHAATPAAHVVAPAAGRLLILKESGELLLAPASPTGFRPTARARLLPLTVRAYPALSSGRLYARNENTLLCIDLRRQP